MLAFVIDEECVLRGQIISHLLQVELHLYASLEGLAPFDECDGDLVLNVGNVSRSNLRFLFRQKVVSVVLRILESSSVVLVLFSRDFEGLLRSLWLFDSGGNTVVLVEQASHEEC